MLLILAVVGAILVAAIADRHGREPALVIVVVGIAASFTPGFPGLYIDSEVLLSVVLPPLLYSAALGFSFPTFLRNIRPILGLGVGLVVVTAFAVAAVASWLVAPLSFGIALVLGAVVAPPDAVTAVAVGRKLGLPKRVMAILTGESLVNDAAALTLFSIAVAHVAGTRAFIADQGLDHGRGADDVDEHRAALPEDVAPQALGADDALEAVGARGQAERLEDPRAAGRRSRMRAPARRRG